MTLLQELKIAHHDIGTVFSPGNIRTSAGLVVSMQGINIGQVALPGGPGSILTLCASFSKAFKTKLAAVTKLQMKAKSGQQSKI